MPLLLIVLAQKSHSSPFEIGLLLGFPCVGGLVEALTITTIRRQFGFGPTLIGIAWLLALLWLFYAIAPNLIIIGMITTGLFTLLAMYDIVQFSYRLALTPDMLQGRIISIFRIGLFACQSLGLGLTGGLFYMPVPLLQFSFSLLGFSC